MIYLKYTGAALVISAVLFWGLLGLGFILMGALHLEAANDLPDQHDRILVGALHLGLAAILGVSAILASWPSRLPVALVAVAVAIDLLASAALLYFFLSPFGLVMVPGVVGVLALYDAEEPYGENIPPPNGN